MSDEVLLIDDADRYGRLRLISWWRQEKLRAAKVLVVGAGALGNEVLKNLALLGVGHVFIIDFDTIESTNLTRAVLYRSADRGKPKSERAARAVQEINPDVRVRHLHGNVITDLGLGVFAEMDVVLGCLDNREAQLWINRQCWKAGRPWVDGAIQEISGVVKVFVPPDSACYECAMTERDYQLINLRYSCPLLRREDVAEGKVPTAPTISSIVAGLQTQEALKVLHGIPVQAGAAMVFNGESNNFYTTRYQRKEDCLSHETYGAPIDVPMGASGTVEELLASTGGRVLHLDRDLLVGLECPSCGVKTEVMKPLVRVGQKEGLCPRCGGVMRTTIVHSVERGGPLGGRTLREVGVPPYDVVKVETARAGVYARLAADRTGSLAWEEKT
ncbi:MAG TPA: ThiF family adenylyltransferase [Planctomycetota bacterium]|nr:ThiF family adenylyltransferase [Planctomycetota bacterium]